MLNGTDVDGDRLTFGVEGADGVVHVLRISDTSATVVLGRQLDREVRVLQCNFQAPFTQDAEHPAAPFPVLQASTAPCLRPPPQVSRKKGVAEA